MYRLLSYCLISYSLMMGSGAYAQAKVHEPFCGKKWYCEMTKDADGKTHPPEKGTEDDFMLFACDSNFTLKENGIVLKGKWTFDDSTAMLTLLQTQLNTIPEKILFHFMEYDEVHLVIVGEEGTDSESTAYFISK